MGGSGVAVASQKAVESSVPFRGSQSAPNLLVAAAQVNNKRSPGFSGLLGLAALDIPSFDLVREFESCFSLPAKAEDPITKATVELEFHDDEGDHKQSATAAATAAGGQRRSRTQSMVDRPLSWLASSKPSPKNAQEQRAKSLVKQNVAAPPPEDASAGKLLERSRTVESFADFAKRSWISKSRSPSPPNKSEKPGRRHRAASASAGTRAVSKAKVTPGSQLACEPTALEPPSSASRALNRASVYLARIKQRPQSVLSRSSAALSNFPGHSRTAPLNTLDTSAVVKNASDNSISSATSQSSSQRASSVDTGLDTDATTASTASENPSITMPPRPTSTDPLWAPFRTLDAEFAKFAAKGSTAARMGVVRSILIPFLRSTAYHPSNSTRSMQNPEDTERRAIILDKWWNGLLAMLVGGNSNSTPPSGLGPNIAALGIDSPILQPVAGVDRPTLLEAATMIMRRPEWRCCTSSFQPLAERSPGERVRARSGTESTVASDPDSLLAESAEHNVRTMFVTNLTTQMALVVEKLSLRHAPLSLVNWCGKACAYAFFFVPGVADVLVRLWALNADLLRRVADEFGLPRRSKGESDDIVALFPPHLHKLGWSSVKSLAGWLRLPAKLPLMLAKIPWHGPWVSRWRGGDTDLVFIFCKYFYILARDFMPAGLPLVEKARAPAFVLVHAQLLSILDSTIDRQASLDALLGPPISDALHGVDAALTAPQLPSNLMKHMDENRLVVLLKDMLAEHPTGVASDIKHSFAEAFVAIAKGAAKRTPRFECASCFMLCDFLEEALLTLDAFEKTVNNSIATSPRAPSQCFEPANFSRAVSYIDWPFWFGVGQMIMSSNNTMSEIRIISFIFTVWDAITADPARKEALCLDWLLTEETFAKFFNHWCPMVRAYYMRLLCWRICRDPGSANELDTKIFLVVSQRLKTVWSHYLWLKQDAEAKGRVNPSTAPSYPAPGKRFLIIRTEVQPPQQSLRVGFDSFSSAFTATLDHATDSRGPVSGSGYSSAAGGVKTDDNMPSFKKRWSLLGKVLPFGSSQESPASDAKRTWEEELEQARRETAASRIAARGGHLDPFQQLGPPTPPKHGPSTAVAPSSDSGSSTGSAPIFDAVTYVFRFTLTWLTGPGGGPMPAGPPRDRILTRPRLPGPAQARVSIRSAGLNGGVHGAPVVRSGSPPPISPGLPPETRRVSGLWQTGLVSEARNARPLSVQVEPRGRAASRPNDRRLSLNVNIALIRTDGDRDRSGMQSPLEGPGLPSPQPDRCRSLDLSSPPMSVPPAPIPAPVVRAERPTGVYAGGAVYAGRALSEWSIVVSECNSFVDRRRDEGVLGLADVEVPALGMEGLGLRPRG